MKLAEKTVEVQSNIQFDESVAVSIDESAVSMVIERLISAYKNPYRAVLREYTSNAYDEHIAAGQSAPVEVSLPSALSPVLKVQDFGRGLTREELKGFGTIGMSTKRDSDEFTGGFGMGSKCALAAASQFTVVSVKNGKRNTVIVARDEHNVPHMNFLPEAETDDDSGTTVIVPISELSKFGDLADFWVGWKPGSILVDGEEPQRSVYREGNFHPVGGGIAFSDKQNISSGQNSIRVLINQVYYVLDYRALGLTYNQWNLLKYYIIKIDNGSVDIAPSREDLLYNARTKAALEKRFNEVLSISSIELAKQVREADTLREALTLREKMRTLGFPLDGLKWKNQGLVLPGDTVKGNRVPNTEGTWAVPNRDSSTKSGYRVEKTWGGIARRRVESMGPGTRRFVVVHSAGDPTFYGTYNNRQAHREAFGVSEYLQSVDGYGTSWDFFITSESENRINRIYRDLADSIISAEDFNAEVAKVRAANRAEEKAQADAKKAHRKLRQLVYIDAYGGTIQEVEAGELVTSGYKYTVVLRNQIGGLEQYIREAITTKKHYSRNIARSLRSLMDTYKIAVILTGKHEDLADYQSVLPPITTFDKLAAKEIASTVKSKSRLELMAARDRDKYSLTAIQMIKDQYLDQIKKKSTREWVKAVREYRDDSNTVRDMHSWFGGWSPDVKAAMDGASLTSTKPLPESPMNRYPLLEHVYGYQAPVSAITDYINIMDKAEKAQKA